MWKCFRAFVFIFCPLLVTGQSIVPDWFLYPEPNEYVGVSLPSDDPQVQKYSALIAALTSWFARNPHKQQMPENRAVLTENIGNQYQERVKYTSKEQENLDFQIVKSHVNTQGELFLSVKIIKREHGNFSFQCEGEAFHTNIASQKMFEIQRMRCHYHHTDMDFGLELCFNSNYNPVSDSWKNQLVISVMPLEYRSFSESPNYNYADMGFSVNSFSFRVDKYEHPCGMSLYFAYMRCLAASINCREKPLFPIRLNKNKLYMYHE